ncbi:MAG: FecR family protein [Ginsengibacter sp.]|jgi:ferric-dicitrate binding protein FerR (iron transport regulator)
MQHPENRLWKLLALKLSGEATPDELNELDAFLKTSADERDVIEGIEAFWNQKNDPADFNDHMEEDRFRFILNAGNEENLKNEEDVVPVIESVKYNKNKWFYAAASVMAILGFALLFKQQDTNKTKLSASSEKGIQQVFVKPGSKSKIILPDGSVVRLNSSSTLSYNNDFNKEVREVNLVGEAYFDITKDAHHPFVVHTSNIDIVVLGTLFNVKSYEQDQTIETTLLRGSIEVYNKSDPSAPKVILKPNEKLVFKKKQDEKIQEPNKVGVNSTKKLISGENISISTLAVGKPDSLKEETSWLYNKLVIDGDDFSKMMEKMERWYGVRIEILSPELKQFHFKGIFENETIGEVLKALQLTVNFRYKINNDSIKIMK